MMKRVARLATAIVAWMLWMAVFSVPWAFFPSNEVTLTVSALGGVVWGAIGAIITIPLWEKWKDRPMMKKEVETPLSSNVGIEMWHHGWWRP